MRKCHEIYKCQLHEYLSCPAKMSLRNCWLLKNGCFCRKDSSLTCDNCFIYQEHQKEIINLIKKAREKDEQAINELFDEYSRFVYQIGKKFFLPGSTKEDLVQEGMIGLFNAIVNYDLKYKTHFDDYASLSIRNRILRAVRMATQLKQKVLSEAYSLDEDPYYYASMFSEMDVEEHVLGKISKNEMYKSFKNILSPMEYKIISMKIADSSVDEMAQHNSLSKKQVENALFRARRKIAVFIKGELEQKTKGDDNKYELNKS
ncbi:MAG: sigma-70 family RNA polymerase sigma factor [Candidatus Eremiobacteraeota bacterium]|nr:sigma-70 family RNA polymerase sigma factor [Candidatus Eremiobacteraeota bacterium]